VLLYDQHAKQRIGEMIGKAQQGSEFGYFASEALNQPLYSPNFGGVTGTSFQFGLASTRLPPHCEDHPRDKRWHLDLVGIVVNAENGLMSA
jgi:hypothetical protein